MDKYGLTEFSACSFVHGWYTVVARTVTLINVHIVATNLLTNYVPLSVWDYFAMQNGLSKWSMKMLFMRSVVGFDVGTADTSLD